MGAADAEMLPALLQSHSGLGQGITFLCSVSITFTSIDIFDNWTCDYYDYLQNEHVYLDNLQEIGEVLETKLNKMSSNFNFGAGGGAPPRQPQVNLGEWMLNQQRQFQEFDRSFGMPSAFGSMSAFDPFSDPFFSQSPFRRRDPLTFQQQQHVPAAALQNNNHLGFSQNSNNRSLEAIRPRPIFPEEQFSPRSKVSFGDKFEIELNVEDFKPEVKLDTHFPH